MNTIDLNVPVAEVLDQHPEVLDWLVDLDQMVLEK